MKKMEKMEKMEKMSRNEPNETENCDEEIIDYYSTKLVKSNAEVLIEFEKMIEKPLEFFKIESEKNSFKIINFDTRKSVKFSVTNNKIKTLKIKVVSEDIRSRIDRLPDNIGNLTELEFITIKYQDISEIPPSFAKLTKLSYISITSSKLKAFDLPFDKFTELEHLDLQFNKITHFPKNIEKAPNLKKLILDGNPINSIPKSIGNLTSLEELTISNCNIATLPKSLKNLVNLKEFRITGNKLEMLPEIIYKNLVNVDDLDILGNKFETVPESFFKFKCNQKLAIFWDNPIRSLSNTPKSIMKEIITTDKDYPYKFKLTPRGTLLFKSGNVNELLRYYKKPTRTLAKQFLTDPKSLNAEEMERLIHETGTPEIQLFNSALHSPNYRFPNEKTRPEPEEIQKIIDHARKIRNIEAEIQKQIDNPTLLPEHQQVLDELIKLNKSNPQGYWGYSTSPKHIEKPKFHVILEITELTLTRMPIPKNIANLTTLKSLTIEESTESIIEQIPFKKLTNLENLMIFNSDLTEIPPDIKYLKNLKGIAISGCQITEIPSWFGNLRKLEEINFSSNCINYIHKSMRNLIKLKDVYLDHNHLEFFPNFIKYRYEYLRWLHISHNPFRSLTNIPKYAFGELLLYEIIREEGDHMLNLDEKGSQMFDVNAIVDNDGTRIKELYEYYKKSPLKLAEQYSYDTHWLTDDERRRLAWEGGPRERDKLEEKLPPDDPILAEINERLSITLKNGLKIMK